MFFCKAKKNFLAPNITKIATPSVTIGRSIQKSTSFSCPTPEVIKTPTIIPKPTLITIEDKINKRATLKSSPRYLASLLTQENLKIIDNKNMGLVTPNLTPPPLLKSLKRLEKIWPPFLLAYIVVVAEKK